MSTSHPQMFVHEALERPSRTTRELPVLSPEVKASLEALLEAAAHSPSEWHTLPGSSLSVRFLSPREANGIISFEIRKHDPARPVARFRYERSTNTLSAWTHDEIEHPNLETGKDLPREPAELAPLVASVIRLHPEIIHPFSVTTPAAYARPDPAVAPSAFSPVSYAFSDIVRHLTSHWLDGHTIRWSWPKPMQFFLAFLGSITLFAGMVALLFLPLSNDQSLDQGLRIQSSGRDVLEFLAPFPVIVVPVIVVSCIFSFITTIIDRRHGPVRLYLGGFLLPYFIGTLLAWLIKSWLDLPLFNTGG